MDVQIVSLIIDEASNPAARSTRFLLMCMIALLVVGVVAKVGWVFLRLARGQKFLLVGLIGFMVYTADALRAGYLAGIPFAPRLIAAIIGVVATACWAVEPIRLLADRWHRRPFTLSGAEGDEDAREEEGDGAR